MSSKFSQGCTLGCPRVKGSQEALSGGEGDLKQAVCLLAVEGGWKPGAEPGQPCSMRSGLPGGDEVLAETKVKGLRSGAGCLTEGEVGPGGADLPQQGGLGHKGPHREATQPRLALLLTSALASSLASAWLGKTAASPNFTSMTKADRFSTTFLLRIEALGWGGG